MNSRSNRERSSEKRIKTTTNELTENAKEDSMKSISLIKLGISSTNDFDIREEVEYNLITNDFDIREEVEYNPITNDLDIREEVEYNPITNDLDIREEVEYTPILQITNPTLTLTENFELSLDNRSMQMEVEEHKVIMADLDQKYNFERNLLDKEAELYYLRKRDYMNHQPMIKAIMRSILFDWLMEVSFKFRFKRCTLHSAIMLIDLYLSMVPNIPTNMLQLVGVVCLCIAAKNEVN
jgi:hypothetical protein